MKYFSWKLAFFFAFVHLMAVLMLGMLVFINALGRAMGNFAAAFARARPGAHDAAGYETAFTVLVQPVGLLLRRFDHISSEWLFALVALNSLLWGLVFAMLIGLVRWLRRSPTKPALDNMPIIE